MSIKVSVVMPVYNAEKYLAKSIESMLSQSLKEIELILVNDGSKDKSLAICEEYAKRDSRIIVINKKNEGACIARNTGISIAKGKYIQLVDADDYIENNMLEEQYNLGEKTNAEVVMCGMKFDVHKKNGQVVISEAHYKDMVLNSQEEIKLIFMDLFDTVGFLVGVAAKGELIDENGKIPKAKQAMLADAIGTTIGAMLGTSTVTCFMESTAGISEGGKTGLTTFTVRILFVLSLFLAPLFIAIPSQATGAALVIVGVMMASCFKDIDFDDYTNAIPAFLTFILMPLTNSVGDGIIFGIVSYTLLKLVTNKKEDINISLIILSIIFICRFIFLK